MKNKAAVALGRRGGKAKNAKLTKEQRNAMMAEVRKGKAVHPKIHTLKAPARFPTAKLRTGMNTSPRRLFIAARDDVRFNRYLTAVISTRIGGRNNAKDGWRRREVLSAAV